MVGSKIGNLHLTMEDFSLKIPNTKPELLISIEPILLEAVDFELCFFHPQTCLYGFIIEFQTCHDDVEGLFRDANKILDQFMGTDAVMIANPSVLALAAIDSCNSGLIDRYFSCLVLYLYERYLRDRLGSHFDFEGLKETFQSLRSFLQTTTDINVEQLKEIDRKLIACRNALKL